MVTIWRDVLLEMSRAHAATPGDPVYQYRHLLAMKTYAVPSLLLRRRPQAGLSAAQAGPISVTQTLRRRIQLAEIGTEEDWTELLVQYLGEREQARHGQPLEDQGCPAARRGRKVVASVHSECEKRASHDLEDEADITTTPEVCTALADLVVGEAPPGGKGEGRKRSGEDPGEGCRGRGAARQVLAEEPDLWTDFYSRSWARP